jgi:Zn-dependent membrane protease YugP
MITGILVHLITLPVEIDASFAKALPILKQGEYIGEDDLQAARSILTACAMTYVSASLASLLQFWRWFRFVR